MTDYAEPLANVSLIAALGLRHVEWQDLARWCRGLCIGVANFEDDPDKAAVAAAAQAELGAALDRELADPSGELAGFLAAGLDRDEIVNNVRLMISGGINEPRDGVGLVMFELLLAPGRGRRGGGRPGAAAAGDRGDVPLPLAGRDGDAPGRRRRRAVRRHDPGRRDGRRRAHGRQPRSPPLRRSRPLRRRPARRIPPRLRHRAPTAASASGSAASRSASGSNACSPASPACGWPATSRSAASSSAARSPSPSSGRHPNWPDDPARSGAISRQFGAAARGRPRRRRGRPARRRACPRPARGPRRAR